VCPETPDTYRTRLRQYKRRESMIVWVGAGLAGLIALVAGAGQAIGGDVPDWLIALLLTSLVLGGGALAWARVKFEWAATQLERVIEDGNTDTPAMPLPAELRKWPGSAEALWVFALVTIAVAGALFLGATWYGVFNDPVRPCNPADHLAQPIACAKKGAPSPPGALPQHMLEPRQ
jgi:hypothetical protein